MGTFLDLTTSCLLLLLVSTTYGSGTEEDHDGIPVGLPESAVEPARNATEPAVDEVSTAAPVRENTVTIHPNPVCPGYNVTFICEFDRSVRNIQTFYWMQNNRIIWEAHAGAHPDYKDRIQQTWFGFNYHGLRMANIQQKDMAVYTCYVEHGDGVSGHGRSTLLVNGTACDHGIKITKGPDDVVAAVGDDVKLTCDVKVPISEDLREHDIFTWTRTVDLSTPENLRGERIYDTVGGILVDPWKFSIRGTYTLVIRDVQLADAGMYYCELFHSRQMRSANVVVVEQQILPPSARDHYRGVVACNVTFCMPPSEYLDPRHIPATVVAFLGNWQPNPDLERSEEREGSLGKNASIISHMYPRIATKWNNGKRFRCEFHMGRHNISISQEVYVQSNYFKEGD